MELMLLVAHSTDEATGLHIGPLNVCIVSGLHRHRSPHRFCIVSGPLMSIWVLEGS